MNNYKLSKWFKNINRDKSEDNSQLPSLPADTDSSFNTWKKKQIIPPNPYTDVLKENIFFKEYMLSKM